jgi:hypothetical protein
MQSMPGIDATRLLMIHSFLRNAHFPDPTPLSPKILNKVDGPFRLTPIQDEIILRVLPKMCKGQDMHEFM